MSASGAPCPDMRPPGPGEYRVVVVPGEYRVVVPGEYRVVVVVVPGSTGWWYPVGRDRSNAINK